MRHIALLLCLLLVVSFWGDCPAARNQSLFFRNSGGVTAPPGECTPPVVSNIAVDSAYGTTSQARVTWDTDIGSNSVVIMAHEDSVGVTWRIFADSTTYTYTIHIVDAIGLLSEYEKYYYKVRSDAIGCPGTFSALDSFRTECAYPSWDYHCYQWDAGLGNRFVVAMSYSADVEFRYRKLGDPFWNVSDCPYSGSYFAGEHYCYPNTVANTTYEWQFRAKNKCGDELTWQDGVDAPTGPQNKFPDTCP